MSEKIIILDSVGSTNNYAMELIHRSQARHGMGVFAIEQTAGKGRSNRKWHTEPGANVQVSFITHMAGVSLNDRFCLSMAAALSVWEVVAQYCQENIFVKWPNDVLINDKKAAGILIENVIQGQLWQWAVTGIGLNVNQTKFDADNATSLRLLNSASLDVLAITKDLQAKYLTYLDRWREKGQPDWVDLYNERLYKKGMPAKLQKGNRTFESTIQSVTREGKLITKDVMEHEWDLDEVRIHY